MQKEVVLIADFGAVSTRLAQVTGLIKQADASLSVNNAHIYIGQNQIRQGSGSIYSVIPFWPADSIFFCPVGGESYAGKWLAVKMASGIVAIVPDNGVITAVSKCYEVSEYKEVLNVENEKEAAKVAGLLASGKLTYEQLGPQVATIDVVMFDWPLPKVEKGKVEGCILMVMQNFGNLTANINFEQWEATGIENNDLVRLTVKHKEKTLFDQVVPVYQSFGFAKEGEPLVFNGSTGFLDFGLNRRNFVKTYLTDILECDDDLSLYPVIIELVEKQGALKK